MFEGTLQNGCCQHLIYPQRNTQLVPAFQRGSLKCLSEAAFNLLPLCWDSVYMWFLFAPFYRVSVSTALPFSYVQAAKLDAGFQSWMFWGLVFLLQGPQAMEPSMGLEFLTLWRKPLQLWLFSCMWVACSGDMNPDVLPLQPSYLSHCGYFIYLLVVEIFSVNLHIVLINSCCVSSCNFGMSIGGS